MKLLLVACCVCIALSSRSQKLDTLTFDVADIKADTKVSIPFAAIQVLDARFDKSNVGTLNRILKVKNRYVKAAQSVVVFPDSLHHYIPAILRRTLTLQKESKDTLVLLVKQFRLSDMVINPIKGDFDWQLLLRLSLSAYVQKDRLLTKLFSVDDLLLERQRIDQKPNVDLIDSDRKNAFNQMLLKLFTRSNWSSTGQSFHVAAVQDAISKRFQLPLLRDASFKMGVYKTFQEFKQNNPSLINVIYEKKKEQVVSLKDMEGNKISLQENWGFCDGQKRYIFFRDQAYELLPSDKSFYFLSYIIDTDLSRQPGFGDYAPQTGLLNAMLIKLTDDNKRKHFFQLNMDDETIYLEDIFGKSSLQTMQKELLRK